MHGCKKCSSLTALLILLLGVALLLVDFGVWTFWDINWWSGLLVIVGLSCLAKSKCSDCQACATPKKGKK
tara:strand:- start:240 stop:449 length:210 start_codon:yes stop_codon:yes gene_type:complete